METKVYQIEEGADMNIVINFIRLLLTRFVSFNYSYYAGTITAKGLAKCDIKAINNFLGDSTLNQFNLIKEVEA